jgi:AraC-like DNA-binding protein/mannose-6-phosphate isomerase-like protein (cupin superfamily)
MNKSQLDKFLRRDTLLEDAALKIPDTTDINMEIAESDLDNVIYMPALRFSLKDGSYRLTTAEPSEDSFHESLGISAGKNIYFNIHPRFLKVVEHSHNFIEMIFVYSGQCRQMINGKKVTLQEGDVCFLDTNVKHSIETAKENDIIINCIMRPSYFDTAFLGRLSENDVLSGFFIRSIYQTKEFNEYIIFPFQKSSKIKQLMVDILCEYFDKTLCSTEVINSYIIVLFAELLRSYKNTINEQNFYSLKNIKISDIILYIENNYKTATLESTAKHFYFNSSYLSTIIKKLTGQNFLDILHEIKIKNAYILLRNSDISIAEVANHVGYSNMSFFYKIFKNKYGVTPAKFRKHSSNL